MSKRLGLLVCAFMLLGGMANAETTQITIYDDGASCPGGCDSHVVFSPSFNGTKFAHEPSSAAPDFKKCSNGSACEVCFDGDSSQCLTVTYRGSGPPKGRFDFSAAFFKERCSQSGLPQALARECAGMARNSQQWAQRTNCIANPTSPACVDVMKQARDAREQDAPLFARCKELGQEAFNRTVEPAQQRSDACAYEKVGTGKNSNGDTWRRLLPAVCNAGTFVGRDGLDCCSGEALTDRAYGTRECAAFYPKP